MPNITAGGTRYVGKGHESTWLIAMDDKGFNP